MSQSLSSTTRIIITTITTLLVIVHVTYDYFNGGVPTHYILRSDTFPGFSNWLGVFIMPILTWVVLLRVNKRLEKGKPRPIMIKGFLALVVGILLSILFTQDLPGLDYIMLSLFGVALLTPLYMSEYLLGYVLGTGFSFGVAIPALFGTALLSIYWIIYWAPRWIISKINS